MERFDAPDGTSIAWHEQGSGPAVLLVHGLGESHASWEPVAERLATDHRVLALDLRGHGASDPATDLGLAAMAGDVVGLCAHLGVRPQLVGHSLGGVVVSAAGPHVAAPGVVCVDQSLDVGEFAALVASVADDLRDPERFEPFMAGLFEQLAGDALPAGERTRLESLRRVDQQVVLGVWSLLLDGDQEAIAAAVDEALAGYDLPYLALFGVDPGPHHAAWLAQRIPGAVVEVWDGSGHYPHLVDPDAFVARLRAFWTRN